MSRNAVAACPWSIFCSYCACASSYIAIGCDVRVSQSGLLRIPPESRTTNEQIGIKKFDGII